MWIQIIFSQLALNADLLGEVKAFGLGSLLMSRNCHDWALVMTLKWFSGCKKSVFRRSKRTKISRQPNNSTVCELAYNLLYVPIMKVNRVITGTAR